MQHSHRMNNYQATTWACAHERARACVRAGVCITGNVANDGCRVSDRPIELHTARTQACLQNTRTQHAPEGLRDKEGFVGVVLCCLERRSKVAA